MTRARLVALLAVAPFALAAATGCSAQTPLTGDAAIKAFVTDIGNRNRGAAIGRLGPLESLSGRPNAVDTPEALVDKLIGCKYASTDAEKRLSMTKINWSCPDGEYLLWLDTEFRAPKLTVGQFVSAATWEKWRSQAPRIAPPPPPVSPGNGQ